jgi:hypothetical protein
MNVRHQVKLKLSLPAHACLTMITSDAGHARTPPQLRAGSGVVAAAAAQSVTQPGHASMIAPQEPR